jgi:hypothetical protein
MIQEIVLTLRGMPNNYNTAVILFVTLALPNIHGVHRAGLSDFSVRDAARQHFLLGKWRSSFTERSDDKMNVQSA